MLVYFILLCFFPILGLVTCAVVLGRTTSPQLVYATA